MTVEGKNWDVFICFSGKDVREDFLPDLYEELTDKYKIDINPFVDFKLRTGKDIENTLLKEIDDSLISLVIFSEHFPCSSFCLNEIDRIRKCMKTSKQIVIPVFYKVNPDDVQALKANSDTSFRKKFLEIADQHDAERKEKWLEALVEISNIKGFDSHNFKTDFRLIKEIFKDVWKHLCGIPMANSDNDSLVGIGSDVEIVKSLLVNVSDTDDEWAIGIWGLTGVGKKTLVGKVYNDTKYDFHSYCFVENVKKQTSLSVIRDKIIKKLLRMEEGSEIRSPNQITPAIKKRLKAMKVLIVFYDVEDPNDLKELAGEYGLYKNGSRTIVTSRKKIFEKKELLDRDALILFSLYAFKQKLPKDGFLGQSKKVIRYCQGLPLALRVLGSNLYGKESTVWDRELEKLADIPNKKIVSILKTSCEGLKCNQLNIFLDIACFLRGEYKDRIERILEGCGLHPESGIEHLINKSLVRISSTNKVEMHDLIQQMGQEIVFDQCQQPRRCNRLWKYEDVYDVLIKETGTEKVEGILIVPFVWKEMAPIPVVPTLTEQLSPTIFKKMSNLRFFKFCNHMVSNKVHFPKGLECLPETLRYLFWLDYPFKSLPLDPKNLVEVCLRYSHLERLWDENKLHFSYFTSDAKKVSPNLDETLNSLKYMDVSYSKDLISIIDLVTVPNLEVLNVEGCIRLIDIPLTPNPSSKLKKLICQSCSELKVPNNLCSLFSLEELDLGRNNFKRLPANINHLSKLRVLNLFECNSLECLPELPKSLKYLNVGGCISLKSTSSSFLSSEGKGEYCNLNFADCINLDMDVRTKFVKAAFEMHLTKQGVNLCIVGSEVPPKMQYKTDASSLPFSLKGQKLIGLSFSAVLSAGYCYDKYTYIGCKADFIVESRENLEFIF